MIAAMLFSSLNVVAQNIRNLSSNQIVITGTIPDSMTETVKNALYITFYNNYNLEDPRSRQIIPFNIVDGKFKVKIMPEGNFGYFDVGGGILRSITNNEFLIERGDSISMDIRNLNDVVFSGKGADKLNFQNWAGKFIWSDRKLWGPNDKMEDIMKYNRKRAVKFMAVAMDVLNRDTAINNINIKNLLRLNTASSISKQYLNSITSYNDFSDSTYNKELKEEINFLITQQNGFIETDPDLLCQSFMYIQYLFELNKAIAIIKTKSYKAPASIVYNNIKSEYSGILRDKILPYCFLGMLKHDPDAIKYLPEALTLVKDSVSNQILKQVAIAKLPGVKAYDFSLKTVDGKQINLSDLKGKVIILETYYNGCSPCRELSIHMEPIAEYYKGKKDVVFINMDGVAKDFKTFEKGAKSGKYGSRQTIYTWTNGLGERHPMLLYYQYYSFPNLLIIGKDGNVISANPERPFDEISRIKFISLINQHL